MREYTNWRKIPKTVEEMSLHPFYPKIEYQEFSPYRLLKKLILQKGIKEIGVEGFSNCYSLEEVKLPEDLIFGDHSSFKGCARLKTINIPNVKKIPTQTFECCISLEKIEIPSSVERIEYRAFAHCVDLKEVVLSPGLTIIDSHAFVGCASLKHINLPDSLLSLGGGTFVDCVNLETIVLPKNLQTLDSKVFHRCESLREVIITSKLKSLGVDTFCNCQKLRRLKIRGNIYKGDILNFIKSQIRKGIGLDEDSMAVLGADFKDLPTLMGGSEKSSEILEFRLKKGM